MSYEVFNVVELKNGNLATVLKRDKNKYKVEEININTNKQTISHITENDIKGIKYSKEN